MITRNTEIKFSVLFFLNENENRYYAVAPQLNLLGYGNSEDEAENDLDRTVDIFIKYHQKNETLDSKLLSLGFRKKNHISIQPKNLSIPSDMINNFTKLQHGHQKTVPA